MRLWDAMENGWGSETMNRQYADPHRGAPYQELEGAWLTFNLSSELHLLTGLVNHAASST